jgi:hypothetical protein
MARAWCPSLYDYLLRAFPRNLHRLVIMGDFNIDYLADSPERWRFLSFLSAISGIQTVVTPTRTDPVHGTKSLIDMVIFGDVSSTVINQHLFWRSQRGNQTTTLLRSNFWVILSNEHFFAFWRKARVLLARSPEIPLVPN